MARLIDADALLQAIEENSPMNWTDSESEIQADIDYKCFADMVRNQPTAYDVDAVVEELENEKIVFCGVRNLEETDTMLIDDAIAIVRKGGV